MAKKKKKSYAEFMRENYGASNDYVDNVQSKFRAKQDEEDDIAPVKTTEKKDKNERTWFKKGAFEDGYQFGDITKTILSTGGDIGENLYTGIIGMGEKIVDAGAMLGAALNQGTMTQAANNEIMYGAIAGKKESASEILDRYDKAQDEVEKGTAKFIAKDLYDEEKVAKKIIENSPNGIIRKGIGAEDIEENSVLGEKSDSLVQSGGQLGATVALQAVGVPWWLTTGATTFGSESESAFNEGATFDEALLSSTISAGAEILTEKISGGIKFGGKTLDDVLIDPFINRLSNKTVRTLAKLGVDAVGEGSEEILSGVMSALGQKISYADDKEMDELFSSEEAFESFIGGLVLGGGNSVINAVKSNKTSLTDNEQAVVDKVYEQAIAEAEKDGKKLTQKEKSKIYDEVMDNLEKGRISTDTIEEVLGGETYSTYKSAVDNETTLQKEYDTLNKMKYGDMTGEQIDRRAELKQQLDDLKANSNTADMKTKLGDEVFTLVKDSKLAESYNEKSRRGQAFEVDLSQYEEKYHGTLKKAVESGYLNNTRRTHEYVDLVAKISADKGVLFDFTNNENLKKSSFAVDGKIVNAYVTKDGITLNIDSPKYLNSVTGHEITHTFEGTEFYEPLKQVAIEYAKTKGEYDSRLETLNKLYNGVEGANVEAELVADLVGDYVFTDSDFVRKLSTENRNVFQKIYDEIKYLCKVATAGSKEARQLEKVKKTFAEVYRESGKTESKAEAKTRYSISEENRVFYTPSGVEVVKNPTNSEYRQMREEIYKAYPHLRGTGEAVLRQTYDEQGNEYYWNAYEGMHSSVEPYINKEYNTRTSQQWEWWKREDKDDFPTDYGNVKYSLSEEKIINTLTGEELDGNTYKVLKRLNKGESVSADEISNLKEVQEGTQKVNEMRQNFIDENPEFSNIPPNDVGTYLLDSEERNQLRNKIIAERLQEGSFSGVDKNGKEEYNGSVKKDKRIDIVIGLPAAGKSSAIVNNLSKFYQSTIVDSDIIKSRLPEFNDGWGAMLVHEESSLMNLDLLDETMKLDKNIVLPIVGSKVSSVERYIEQANDYGYEINIHLNELPNSKAIGRMLKRYFDQGRFINPSFAIGYGNKPTEVYEQIKQRGDISGYSRWSNDVEKGQRPILQEISGNNRLYGAYNGADGQSSRAEVGRIESETTSGETQSNQIAPIKETSSNDGVFSLSEQGEKPTKHGDLHISGEDVKLETAKQEAVDEDIAPVMDNTPITEEEAITMSREALETIDDKDAPPEVEEDYYELPDTTSIDDKTLKNIGKELRETLSLTPQETKAIQSIVQEYSTSEFPSKEELFDNIRKQFGEKVWKERNNEVADVKRHLRTTKFSVDDIIKTDIADYSKFRKSLGSKIKTSKDAISVDTFYQELTEIYPDFFSEEITNPTDQFLRICDVAEMEIYETQSYDLDDDTIQEAVDIISKEVSGYKQDMNRAAAEEIAKEDLESIAPAKAVQITNGMTSEANLLQSLDNHPIKTVKERVTEKLRAVESEIADNKQLRREAETDYNSEIARLTDEYVALKDKNTKKANNIVQRIIRLERLKASVDSDYAKRISDLEARVEKMNSATYQTAVKRQTKQQEHTELVKNLVGDTSTWKDKKTGLQYEVNTLHRNLRDIVRDKNGNKDIAKADKIYNEFQGKYNQHEAEAKREATKIKKVFADMKITKAESTYIQMLGELRSNPQTTLTEDVVKEFYQKHKKNIDKAKVEKAIKLAHNTFDSLLERVNATLREQGMKEIPYRQGYFPHFVEPKQNFIQKLFNWKTQDGEIPTDIAGLTEDFNPERSWQSFNKERKGDVTDYNFTKGLDNYVQGALDWIYHIDDIQKRRALENYIRYVHSDKGVQERIDAVYNNEEYDADETQAQIDLILSEARNPLNNFIVDFRTGTNILAGKKNSLDRTTEQTFNRNIYSIMNNVQSRMSANMVLANVRSALTNFIPITQSWAQVSPVRTLQAVKDTIKSSIKDDGLIDKSTFLTNRLKNPENLYQTTWDKVLDKAGIMFEIADNISSQVIWRSKYNQNIAKGMSESQAIANADQFAENVMAGRSKGNEPTLFNAKNPFVKAFTMFQLEVNNQYGYFFKDVPNDLKTETNHWKLNLAKGYTTAFVGAHLYNALMEEIAGSGAALDPIGIIKDLLQDLGLGDDDEEEKEPSEVVKNLAENIVEELPFVGGLFGGGRIPISSALPYNDKNLLEGLETFGKDLSDFAKDDWSGAKNIGKELMNPLLSVVAPVGGGQIKKTAQGLKMFKTDEDHPVAGSYTDSGALRFPVDDTLVNRIQAGIFGQYANKNAREYFDNGYAPLKEKQIQEFVDVDLPIADYWQYREGLSGLKKLEEKAEYINSLDLKDWQKNLLINNIADRKEDIDMSNYDDYSGFDEFDFAQKNTEKYTFFKENGISYEDYANADEDGKSAYTWAYNNPEKYTLSKAVTDDVVTYRSYISDLYDIKADKDENGDTIMGSGKEKKLEYINNLDLDYGQRIILYRSLYSSKDDKAKYNSDIVDYLDSRDDISWEEMKAILEELDFTVNDDGTVEW